MAAPETQEQEVTLRILVDEKKNKVVYAEAGKDFMDVLLSFLTLPLGTIVKIVSNESNMKKISVGGLSSLYESVANLEVKHFWTETCKEMLLQPKNSSEAYCQNIKLNIDDTEKMKYFICENWECSRKESGGLLSLFRNRRCKCGNLMNREISPQNMIKYEGFVPDMSTFIIFDDLKVMPDNVVISFSQLKNFGYEDFNSIKVVTAKVIQKEIVDLLKCSILSETPLTDFFLRREVSHENLLQCSTLVFNNGEAESNEGELIKLKVMRRKSNNKILFALAEDEFIDILFSFLTFPLGGVEHMLKGNSCLGSMDNLYNSIVDLDGNTYLKSPDIKDKLVNSRLAQQFKLQKQILPIDEVPISNYSCYSVYASNNIFTGHLTAAQGYSFSGGFSSAIYAPLSYLEPQSSTFDQTCSSGSGFVKRPSFYMVTDDLVVTPGSSISVISFLTGSSVSPSDLEERVISIGKKECLSLLKASLISSSALTDGLGQFIYPIKEEKFII